MKPSFKHRTLSAALLEEIRQDILSGRYKAGTQLRQDALAEAYGVSRIPIREALFQLEAAGLVKIMPQKGAVVSHLSREEIEDVFQLRILLEPRLLLASAPQLTDEDYERLQVKHLNYVEAISANAVNEYGRLNADLHLALYHRANLPRTAQIVTSLLETSDRYTRIQLSNPAAMQRAMTEHADLIQLCRSGRFQDAARFLAEHVAAVQDDLVMTLAKVPETGPPDASSVPVHERA
ncbi:GntR family transcriptional regulator [Pseudorhizobium endolithicum]|uniref:GntR family transcriptional regulator n=1 Tax=Pseudorhizobium endolithicum TaxID=1191678 RepID=A0ABM8PKY3_9HYPH|nr:GntR family transcriptional regulator [Pseudorhizobium endolithicum]CAD7035601.1 GntR family transcriptional regulator [Pseudorhizobium endolithicum]